MINLHLLRQFVTVAEENSFSRAAAVMFLSQPAVSQAVQELERSLGITLIDRAGRQIRLTEAGEILLGYARTIFATERAAEQALVQLKGLEHGRLAIGASSTIGTYLLPSILGQFRQRYPGIRLSLEIGNTPQIAEKLVHGSLDTAFVEGLTDESSFVVRRWREDELVLISSPSRASRLRAGGPLSLSRFQDEPFVMREAASGTRQLAERYLQQQGLRWTVAFELGSTEAIKQAVIADLGVAIVSIATIQTELQTGQLVVVRLPDFSLRRWLVQIAVLGRPGSPAQAALEQIMYEFGDHLIP